MNRAFTLIEMMVVMAIMGLLGTMSVGGYVAMQRGMEERGVMQSVNSFVRAAYQRATIDRQPVVVYVWNETIREQSEDHNEIVVGRAVAVRRHGRLSDVRQGGELLVDEFADLNVSFASAEGMPSGGGGSNLGTMFVYPVDNVSSFRRTTVSLTVRNAAQNENFLFRGDDEKEDDQPAAPQADAGDVQAGPDAIPAYAFAVVDKGGVNWKPGMAYGMEFAALQLPHNYIFGSQYSKSMGQPVAGETVLRFSVQGAVGTKTVTVSSLRPDGASLRVEKVATSDPPDNKEEVK